jgi:hypothetical protein
MRRTIRRAAAYTWCAALGAVVAAAGFWFLGLWTEAYMVALAAAFLLASFVPRLR